MNDTRNGLWSVADFAQGCGGSRRVMGEHLTKCRQCANHPALAPCSVARFLLDLLTHTFAKRSNVSFKKCLVSEHGTQSFRQCCGTGNTMHHSLSLRKHIRSSQCLMIETFIGSLHFSVAMVILGVHKWRLGKVISKPLSP